MSNEAKLSDHSLTTPDSIGGSEDGWQDIATAPRDGTEIQVRIPGHGEDNVVAWVEELLNSWDEYCGAWAFTREQEPPESWSDGYCWAVNDEGCPSEQPTHWLPLPPAPTMLGGA